MNLCHDTADQAADFAADQTAQQVVWAGFQWWHHSDGVTLFNTTRDTDQKLGSMTEVGGLFGGPLARRASL